MSGSLTVLVGVGKGTVKPLISTLTVVGRSKNADFQLDDPLISRRHLEIRIETEGVFVENLSTHGSSLNGVQLVGVVSLNAGDVIEIGNTKIRFDDVPPQPASSSAIPSFGAIEAEIDGTRIADPGMELPSRKEAAPPDATRAVVDDGTRMLNPSELPRWVAQEKIENKTASRGKLVWVLVLYFLSVLGGGYWFMFLRGDSHNSRGGLMEYHDSVYMFNLEYPLDWAKISDDTGVIVFGFGAEASQDWGRLKIYTDNNVEYEVTGLTDGFLQYMDNLKKRYEGFELIGHKEMNVNGATVVFFGFDTPALQGKGIFLINADARIVLECVSPNTCYSQYASSYSSLLQSFHLEGTTPQQFIDFPQPNTGMQQLALANPTELARQVDEHAQLAGILLASRDVKPDNLYMAVQEYRKAIQLAIAGPQRLPAYRNAAQGLSQASRLFNQALIRQRFEINSAVKQGDNERAFWEANKLMQMVPDKIDPAYQEASRIVSDLPPAR